MPNLAYPVSVGLTTVAVEKLARGRSYEVSAKRGVVAGGSTWAIDMILKEMPQAKNVVLGVSEEYGAMLASAALSTVVSRKMEKKAVMKKGAIKDFLFSLGEQAGGAYVEGPLKPYLPTFLTQ